MADFLGQLPKVKNIRKFKSALSLISMNLKFIYHSFVLCKKPLAKRPIRREREFFVRVSKMAIFVKVNFLGLKTWEIQVGYKPH